jgi:DNA-binding response OmpR family regulator
MNVLLVEDDARVASFVQRGLQQVGIPTEVASDGNAGLARALAGKAEVVILDLLLPGLDGRALLAELRRRGKRTPVLVLSALDGAAERVRMLDGGADDFLVKPFDFDELVARLRALSRRQGSARERYEVGDLSVDTERRIVLRGTREIELTAREFALLEYLLRNRDGVVTRAMIAERVWGQPFGSFSNVIDVYIRYLRAKVDHPGEERLIHTVRGVGYRLSAGA